MGYNKSVMEGLIAAVYSASFHYVEYCSCWWDCPSWHTYISENFGCLLLLIILPMFRTPVSSGNSRIWDRNIKRLSLTPLSYSSNLSRCFHDLHWASLRTYFMSHICDRQNLKIEYLLLLDLRKVRDNLYGVSASNRAPVILEYTDREMEVGKHIRKSWEMFYLVGEGHKDHPPQVSALVFLTEVV